MATVVSCFHSFLAHLRVVAHLHGQVVEMVHQAVEENNLIPYRRRDFEVCCFGVLSVCVCRVCVFSSLSKSCTLRLERQKLHTRHGVTGRHAQAAAMVREIVRRAGILCRGKPGEYAWGMPLLDPSASQPQPDATPAGASSAMRNFFLSNRHTHVSFDLSTAHKVCSARAVIGHGFCCWDCKQVIAVPKTKRQQRPRPHSSSL